MSKYSTAILAVCITVILCAPISATQVLTNGDFEGGLTGGVPSGWTLVSSSVYSHDGYTANWQLFSDSLNAYPPLDVYAGNHSLGVYRTDGEQRNIPRPGLEFYEFNVLYQNIPVSPNTTYYVKVSAAAFVHHDRMRDTEDFWGAGVGLRICPGSGQYSRSTAVWEHGFWNWEGDSFWRYYPELKNQTGSAPANKFTTGPTQTSITFSIIWFSKWNSDTDLCAVDDISLDLSTNGPEPVGSDDYIIKDPANWSSSDIVWNPINKLPTWSKQGATNGGDQFYQSTELTVGMRPMNSTVADFNDDGLPDIAVASFWSHLVSVFLQKPDGGFGPGLHLTGTIMPRCVQAGQVVGGPAIDLVVSSAGRREVAVFEGNGDGTFATPALMPVAMQPTWIALADFDGDTAMDMAVGGQKVGTDGEVYIYLGDGAGGFTLSQTIPNISNCSYIIATDLGGDDLPDGIPDLAILEWNGPAYVYKGLGNGTFDWGDTISAQGRWKSTGMAAGNFDLDPDNIPDLCIVYMWEADWAQIVTGYGNCIYERYETEDWLRPSRYPSGASVLDIDDDGRPDIAFSNFESDNVVIYRHAGFDYTYHFNNIGHFGVGQNNTSIITADINLDGYEDMVVTSGGCQTVNVLYGGPYECVYAPNSRHTVGAQAAAIGNFVKSSPRPDLVVASDVLRVYNNLGGMNFSEASSTALAGVCVDLVAGDLNLDGNTDVAVYTSGGSSIFTYFGNGAGAMTQNAIYPVSGAQGTQDLALADVDNAAGPDLIACEAQTYLEGIYCRLNNGAGNFGGVNDRKKSALPFNSKPRDIATGDFNSDGRVDIVVALAGQNKFGFMAGNGDGLFGSPVTFATGVEPTGICAVDLNGDSKLDIAVTNKADNTLSIFFGNGAGSFATAGTIALGNGPTHVQNYDINSDGAADLVVSCPADRTVWYLRGNGDGTFEPAQVYRTTAAPNRTAAGDLRGIGLQDLVVGGQFEIFRNSLLSNGSVSVTDDGTAQSDTGSISGYWQASIPGGRPAERYRWAVSTTPDVTGIIPGGGWIYTTATSGTRNIDLSMGQTYYILVQAEDTVNLWTPVAASDGILVSAAVGAQRASEAKEYADGQAVVLSGVVVSRVWSTDPWVCYVQDADRASGIRVEGTGAAPIAGAAITVTGVLGSIGPERKVIASGFEVNGNPGEPDPLGLNIGTLGGGSGTYDPGPPATGQMGVTDGAGINNVGLLVRLCGKVTRSEDGEAFFYLDDGSGTSDATATGVRCIAEGLDKPDVGSQVIVTGASGVMEVGSKVVRCLRVQRQPDIRTISAP